MAVFRHRGIRTVVDTSQQAEFDFASIPVAETVQERIGVSLRTMPISTMDRVIGHVRVRLIEGFDIIYTVERVGAEQVVTIGGVERPDPEEPTEDLILRAAKEALPGPVKVLIEGRRRKRD